MSLYAKPHSNAKQQQAEVFARAESMLDKIDDEKRDFSATEQREYNQLLTRIENLEKQKSLEAMAGATHQQPDNEPLFPGDNPMAGRISAGSVCTMKAFSNDQQGREAAFSSGMFIRAALLGDERSRLWCRDAGMAIDDSIRMAHSAGSNALGGVLVPEQFSATVIKLIEEYGIFRRLARVNPMSSDSLHIPRRTGGLTAYYTGEGETGTSSDTSWDDVQLVAKKLMVLTRMSSELSDDAIVSFADQLAEEIGLAFALKEDTVGFSGTGISTDGGIVGVNTKAVDGSHGMATVAAASGHDTLPEIDADDIINLLAAVPSYAKRGSSFVCSPSSLEVVFNAIKIAGGGNSLENLSNMVTPRFLGYPVEVTDVYPDNVTTVYNGLPMIGFGNLAQAVTLGVRRELRLALSTDAYFAEDQIGVKGTMRHDINVHDLGSDTAKSPFVVLTGTT